MGGGACRGGKIDPAVRRDLTLSVAKGNFLSRTLRVLFARMLSLLVHGATIIAMTEDDFKKKLTPEEYRTLRERGTETPFTGKYWNEHTKGIYRCRACGAELFSSDTKFDSGTGWPSFTSPAKISQGENSAGGPTHRANVDFREDKSYGMDRVEVTCKNCGSHLGHVFDDGPREKGGKRYCINSACLELEKEGH